MNKKTLSTLLAALVITVTANTGLAAEPDDKNLSITGEATLHWERAKVKGGPSEHTGEQTLTLDFNQPLSKEFSLYTRFAYRNFSGDNKDSSIHELDQYGLIYKDSAGTLNLGSQSLEFGTLAALVDLTEVGRDAMFKGATWTSENEYRKLHLIAGRVDKSTLETDRDKTVTGITLGKTFGDVTVSGEYLHTSNTGNTGSVYGLGLSTSVDKWAFSLAGLKSSADTKDSGIIADITYTLSDTDTLSATYRNFKENAVIGGLATYDPDTKGVELVWAKSLSDKWSLELSHEWAKSLTSNEKTRTAYIETTYSF